MGPGTSSPSADAGESEPRFARIPATAMRLGVFAAPVFALIGVFLATLGTDEAWIQLGIRGLARGEGFGADSPAFVVHTTGGLFVALSALLQWIGQEAIQVVRLSSVAALTLLLLLSKRWSDALGFRGSASFFAAALVLSVPGVFFLSSVAYGAVLAALLVVGSVVAWGHLDSGLKRSVLTGLLAGSAVAIRMNTAPALVVPALSVLFERKRRGAEAVQAFAALVVGVAVYLAQKYALAALAVDIDSPNVVDQESAKGSLSLSDTSIIYMMAVRLEFFERAEAYFPALLKLLITVGWFVLRPKYPRPKGVDTLLGFAWLLSGAWLLMAPIPHLRYLLPSSIAFAVVGGIVLGGVVEHRLASRRFVELAIFLCLGIGYVRGATDYQFGNNDLLSWEWNGRSRHAWELGTLRAIRDERAVFDFIEKEIPAEDTIATLGFSTTFAFATGRDIRPLKAHYTLPSLRAWLNYKPEDKPPMPRWLLTTPFTRYFPTGALSPRTRQWLDENCTKVQSFNAYEIYRIDTQLPDAYEIIDGP